jgi:glycosyltransferase involved in cell wall biosynthesis
MAAAPAVSIILPTYNRAAFLPQAITSIRAQELTDWELVVVDDGSTDDTAAVLARLTGPIASRVTVVTQSNGGAYAARNTGLDHARGRAIAFFDSDDEWLPHHLARCQTALERWTDVHWVYGASQLVDHETGAVLCANTFYPDGTPRPFRRLRSERRDDLHVIDEPDVISRILSGAGLFCGLQNSLIRREVFDRLRFEVAFRNESEDQVFVIRALAMGFRFAYFDAVHHTYHVHRDNSSASAVGLTTAQGVRVYSELIRGFEALPRQVDLTSSQQRALNERLSREYFWHLGFATLWPAGRRREALAAYRQGLRLSPWRPDYWKTYGLALIRSIPALLTGQP